jgi:hypothetical protein
MPAHYRQEWERHRHSFLALAGIEWKTHLDQMAEIKRNYPHINIFEVKYEAFCAQPIAQLRQIAEFCELSWEANFVERLKQHYVASENSKWQSELTTEQRAILQEVLADRLVEQGYELSGAGPALEHIDQLESGDLASRR